jgi:Tol biopolymer transport system component
MTKLAVTAAAAGTLMLVTAAGATSPGSDGRIAYSAPVESRHTTFAISAVDSDGGHRQQLTHPPDGVLDEQPDWSPDGSRVAFERCGVRCAVYVVDRDGSGLRRVGPACNRKPPACADRVRPVWSPDGRHIAFTRYTGRVRRGRIAHSELTVMRADGHGARAVTRLSAAHPHRVDIGRASWSPDGSQLAFGLERGRKTALFIIHANGSGLKRLTAWSLRAGEHPDFSPDGHRILFGAGSRGEQDRGGNLYSIGVDGAGLTRLTGSGRNGKVLAGSFAPSGTRITYAALPPDEDFATSLFISETDGAGAHAVPGTAFAMQPDWGG